MGMGGAMSTEQLHKRGLINDASIAQMSNLSVGDQNRMESL